MIDVDSKYSKIGISISGGADSALLAWMICKQSRAQIHFVYQIRMWKTRPWQEYYADRVMRWFRYNFPHEFVVHKNFVPPEMEEPHTDYITDEYGEQKPGNRIILRAHNEYIAHTQKLDAWYAGVTLNPPVTLEGELDDRNTPSYEKHKVIHGVNVHHPFVDKAKDWVMRQYLDNNLHELLRLTRSCEGEFEGIDYTNYRYGEDVYECGKCFWCRERKWGLDNAFQ